LSPVRAVSLYYLFAFAGTGVFWPNYGPFLEQLGLAPQLAGMVLGANPFIGLFVPPLVGLLADARRARVWILRGFASLSAVAFGLWALEPGAVGLVFGLVFLNALARAPLSALADASAFDVAARHATSFGRLRVFGSLGFLVAAPVGGALLEHAGRTAMVAAACTGLALAATCAWSLPAPPPQRREGAWRAWKAAVRAPGYRRFLLCVLFGWMGNGALDGCFSLHLSHLGHGNTFIGSAWAVGVVSEVVLMWRSADLIARFGVERLLAFALAVAALRWLLISQLHDPVWILVAQPLHGITFGCTFVAAATIARQRAPIEAPTAAQGVFTAVAAAGTLIGITGGSQLLAHGGGRATFLAAAGCATLAMLLCARLRPVAA
jgi:PPP family 3-phenylpropionic acid transporter